HANVVARVAAFDDCVDRSFSRSPRLEKPGHKNLGHISAPPITLTINSSGKVRTSKAAGSVRMVVLPYGRISDTESLLDHSNRANRSYQFFGGTRVILRQGARRCQTQERRKSRQHGLSICIATEQLAE